MNDRIANQIASYRTRLTCLDLEAHTAIWQNQPPVIFTTKVANARASTDELTALAGRQSAVITGSAADKVREEKELEDTAYILGSAATLFARDQSNEEIAAKYDLSLTGWRRLRNEDLLQKASGLIADAGALATGATTTALAEEYGITTAAADALNAEAIDFKTVIAAPQDTITDRSSLTTSLREKARQTTALFDQLTG